MMVPPLEPPLIGIERSVEQRDEGMHGGVGVRHRFDATGEGGKRIEQRAIVGAAAETLQFERLDRVARECRLRTDAGEVLVGDLAKETLRKNIAGTGGGLQEGGLHGGHPIGHADTNA